MVFCSYKNSNVVLRLAFLGTLFLAIPVFWAEYDHSVGNPNVIYASDNGFPAGGILTPSTVLRIASSDYSAEIADLSSPDAPSQGGTATFWAEVKNTGSSPLPSDAHVWFFVWGPSVFQYVGAASVASLAPGDVQWYSYGWLIPADVEPGAYTFWAVVATDVIISEWSDGRNFTIGDSDASAEILNLKSVDETTQLSVVQFGAEVFNTGTSVLPSDSYVGFFVWGEDTNIYEWAGWTPVAGLPPGTSRMFTFDWTVPFAAPYGTYWYWAVVYTADGVQLSEWSPDGEPFMVIYFGF